MAIIDSIAGELDRGSRSPDRILDRVPYERRDAGVTMPADEA